MAYNISDLTVINDSRNLTANITNLKTVGGSSILGTGDITEYATANLGVIIASGTNASLSGLNLTGYSFLKLVFESISHNGIFDSRTLLLGPSTTNDVTITGTFFGSNFANGVMFVGLSNGSFHGYIDQGSTPQSYSGICNITKNSTAVSIALSGSSFDAGKVIVYGMAEA